MATAAFPILSGERGQTRNLNKAERSQILEPEQEQEYRLAERWREQDDGEAAQQLLTSHRRLVVKLARDACMRFGVLGAAWLRARLNNRSRRSMRLAALMLASAELCSCQSTQQDRAELVRICADPWSRSVPDPGNIYFHECQVLHPPSAKQLAEQYLLYRPEGDSP